MRRKRVKMDMESRWEENRKLAYSRIASVKKLEPSTGDWFLVWKYKVKLILK